MATGNALTQAYSASKKKKRKGGININPAHKGQLHAALNVPADQPIPASKLSAAKNSASADLRRKATFAVNAKKFRH